MSRISQSDRMAAIMALAASKDVRVHKILEMLHGMSVELETLNQREAARHIDPSLIAQAKLQ